MKTYKNIEQTKEKTCVALGFFDGLHLGHMKVISEMINFSKSKNLVPTIFTFKESPKVLTLKDAIVEYLISQKEKEMMLCKSGIKLLYSVPFSLVMNFKPEDFVKKILVEKLNAKHVFCGFNYHFGKDGKSDVKKLIELCKLYDVEVHEVPPVVCDGKIISSTLIRSLLKSCDIKLVNKMLGRNYSYKFPVVHGLGLGGKLLMPTINQNFPKKFIIPCFGVYASFAIINNQKYWSVTNIGVNPTVGINIPPHSETFIPDYVGRDLYNEEIEIQLCEFLREEKKFSTIEKLKDQILIDKKRAKSILGVT